MHNTLIGVYPLASVLWCWQPVVTTLLTSLPHAACHGVRHAHPAAQPNGGGDGRHRRRRRQARRLLLPVRRRLRHRLLVSAAAATQRRLSPRWLRVLRRRRVRLLRLLICRPRRTQIRRVRVSLQNLCYFEQLCSRHFSFHYFSVIIITITEGQKVVLTVLYYDDRSVSSL